MASLPDWDMPTNRPVLPTGSTGKENAGFMVILGIDAHKRTHTVAAIDGNGRRLASKTFGTTTADHSRCCAGPTSSTTPVTSGGGR